MSESTLSLIRHILTALGTVLTLLGLTKYTGIVDYLTNNLDAVQAAIVTLVGVVTAIWGFLKNKDRLQLRTDAKK